MEFTNNYRWWFIKAQSKIWYMGFSFTEKNPYWHLGLVSRLGSQSRLMWYKNMFTEFIPSSLVYNTHVCTLTCMQTRFSVYRTDIHVSSSKSSCTCLVCTWVLCMRASKSLISRVHACICMSETKNVLCWVHGCNCV